MYEFDIDQAIKVVESQMQSGIVRNPRALLRAALKDRWKPNV